MVKKLLSQRNERPARLTELQKQQRDTRIGHHIETRLKQLTRGRVVLVMGADHATFVREWIATVFADRVRLVEQLPTASQ